MPPVLMSSLRKICLWQQLGKLYQLIKKIKSLSPQKHANNFITFLIKLRYFCSVKKNSSKSFVKVQLTIVKKNLNLELELKD